MINQTISTFTVIFTNCDWPAWAANCKQLCPTWLVRINNSMPPVSTCTFSRLVCKVCSCVCANVCMHINLFCVVLHVCIPVYLYVCASVSLSCTTKYVCTHHSTQICVHMVHSITHVYMFINIHMYMLYTHVQWQNPIFPASKLVLFFGSHHCTSVLQTQITKLCTALNLGLLYILISGTNK